MMLRVTVLLILIIFVLSGIATTQLGKVARLKKERSQLLEFSNTQKREVTIYRNKLDRETAKVQVLDLSLSNAKELISNERLSFVRQFNGINKRLNNLEQITMTTATVVNEWELPLRDTVIVNMDSTVVTGKVFSYSDSLNKISGRIIGGQIIPRIEITVPLQGAMYWERKKILGLPIGRKRWFSDITSTNPIVKIQSHETIRIKRK